ncbi:trypsin-like [Bacillus rossius redtenbacheri]|uniref:trypsin-like n=1 Tax=Bacillus rossius redtenbacheri TaxID=93214 RepID=UPI002FDE8946
MNIFLVSLLISSTFLSFIVRGTNGQSSAVVQIDEYPYMVSLHLINGGHRCTATIISWQFTLTTASCLYDSQNDVFLNSADLRLVYGAKEMDSSLDYISQPEIEVRFVVSTYIHPRFDLNNFFQNLAMLKVHAPWGERVKYAMLPEYHVGTLELPMGLRCNVVGWWSVGKCNGTKTLIPSLTNKVGNQELWQNQMLTLRTVKLHTIKTYDCSMKFSHFGHVLQNLHLCTYSSKEGNCDGDAGAPLICDHLLVGILSWGPGYKENGIAMPLVYARVDVYLEWINTVITVFASRAVMARPSLALLALPMLLAMLEVTL